MGGGGEWEGRREGGEVVQGEFMAFSRAPRFPHPHPATRAGGGRRREHARSVLHSTRPPGPGCRVRSLPAAERLPQGRRRSTAMQHGSARAAAQGPDCLSPVLLLPSTRAWASAITDAVQGTTVRSDCIRILARMHLTRARFAEEQGTVGPGRGRARLGGGVQPECRQAWALGCRAGRLYNPACHDVMECLRLSRPQGAPPG